MSGYRRLKEETKRHPEKVVKAYIAEIKARLGVEAGQPWTLLDWSKKIQWGKFKSFMRAHVMMGEAVRLIDTGQPMHAMAHLCQCMKATHQAALDQGSWRNAWLLTLMEDPLAQVNFGGEERELEVIAGYTRALADLQQRTWAAQPWTSPTQPSTAAAAEEDQTEESGPGRGKPRGRGRGKGRK
jgi:hypothetical protein